MQCEHVKERWADYTAGGVGPAERAEIDRHLAACESCRADTAGLEEVWTLLDELPDETPSPVLRARVDALIDAWTDGARQPPAAPARGAHPTDVPWWRRFAQQPALQFALAGILLVVGFAGGRIWPASPEPDPELATLRGEVQSMKQMVALSLLQQQSAAERLRGVTWSHQIEDPGAPVTEALLETLAHDANVNVRLAAVDALKELAATQRGSDPREGLIASITKQESPLVEIALVDALVELREQRSVDVLRTLAGDRTKNDAVRARAEWALARLTQPS